MSISILKKIRQAIDQHRMLDVFDGVVVAVSGGPDSVALLLILQHLSREYSLKLIVAHLNHGLESGLADAGEAFVQDLSKSLGLTCESRKVDVASLSRMLKKSIEETAREERYRFLEEVCRRHHARKIALGHHAQDQAETVLMNLLRGSGREGMKGMAPVRDGLYIRPLLNVTRTEISHYLSERHVPYLTDPSNIDERYFRNKVRHRLLPELKAGYDQHLEEHLCRTAEIFRLEDDYLKRRVTSLYEDPRMVRYDEAHQETRISLSVFLNLHEALQGRLIKHLLLVQAGRRQGIGYVHIHDVKALMRCPHPSGLLHLPFGLEARREYDILVIGRRKRPPRVPGASGLKGGMAPFGRLEDRFMTCDVDIPGQIRLDEQKRGLALDLVDRAEVRFGKTETAYMDYDRIQPPLKMRAWLPGDRIQPLGMSGMKKVKKWFIDRKIPLEARKNMPLLVDGASVIWVAGQLISERVKITDQTARVLKIEMIEMI